MEITDMRDPYDDQLRAARYRAERDQAREELDRAGRRIRGLESALQEARCTRAEDREAGEWVRGHGGLDVIEAIWDNDVPMANGVISALWSDVRPDDCSNERVMDELRKRLMPAGYEWDDRFAGAVDFFETMHDLLYTVDCEDEHDGPEMVREVMRRLMPRGYEWPRYEDGEPVVLSDHDQRRETISSVAFEYHSAVEGHTQPFVELNSMVVPGSGTVRLDIGERVKRPSPIVDADGAECRIGDTVYHVGSGELRRVTGFRGEYVLLDGRSEFPLDYTHRVPALAADGKPLREGETVCHVADGRACVVREVRENGAVVDPVDGRPCGRCRADYLTHERPDRWERLEEDARSVARDIAWNLGNWSPSDFENVGDDVQARVVDLVRRARALAGVSE